MWIEWLNNIKTDAISFWESIDVSKVVDLFVYDGQNPLMFNTGLFLFLFVGFIWIYRLLARRDTLRIYFVILFLSISIINRVDCVSCCCFSSPFQTIRWGGF